jgi:DNA-binding transcriptional ArsR family regulator
MLDVSADNLDEDGLAAGREGLRLAEQIAQRMWLLGQPLRIAILSTLAEGERSVQALADDLDASQQNVSRHLGLLRDAGLVTRRQQGRNVWYALRDRMALIYVDEMARWLTSELDSSPPRAFLDLPGLDNSPLPSSQGLD